MPLSKSHSRVATNGTKPAAVGLPGLFSVPSIDEVQACWELCRLHNNIGFWVVWIPTAWSIAMFYHANATVNGVICLKVALFFVPLCFGVKSLIMTIDDILDHDVDLLVERTRKRPLPRGAISVPRAWLFFALQVVVGIFLATVYLKAKTMYISATRWMDFAPIPLGLMFAIGAFMGWSQLSPDGDIPWHILTPLFLSCVFWTMTYETVYQHQDKVDDQKIGIHSPALYCAEKTIPLCTFSALCFFGLLIWSGFLNGQGIPFYVAVAIAAKSLFPQLLKTNIDEPDDCKRFFLGTPRIGQIILGGLVIDAILHRLVSGTPL
ncbi:hypothetical protein H0H92_007245 [Tricholoma furcatifolium]|nr:hypothetical protein H0H92_007245 [Tricholoma furcatifolium]